MEDVAPARPGAEGVAGERRGGLAVAGEVADDENMFDRGERGEERDEFGEDGDQLAGVAVRVARENDLGLDL